MTMTAAQLTAFKANGATTPDAMAVVLISFVFAVLLLWSAWAIRTAYVGWVEGDLNRRQFFGVVLRVFAMYLVLPFFLLS